MCLDTWTAKKTKWWFDKRRREQTNNLKTEHRCISWACDSYFRGQLRLPGFKAAIKVFSVENPVLQHNNAPIVCSHQAKHKCDQNKILCWTQLIKCTWVKGQSAQLFVRGCFAWHSAHRGSHLSSDLSYDAPTHHHHLWSAAPGWWHVKLVKTNNQFLLICCSLNPGRNCRINYKRSFREKAESWSLKEISLLPRTIKPSTLTGFMFAPPHDGFYSTVISEHVKYHGALTNNLTSSSDLRQCLKSQWLIVWCLNIAWEEEYHRENSVLSVYIAPVH